MSEAHRFRRTLRGIGAVLTGRLAIVVILYLSLYIVANRALNKTDIDAKQKTVTSKDDGTLSPPSGEPARSTLTSIRAAIRSAVPSRNSAPAGWLRDYLVPFMPNRMAGQFRSVFLN